MKVLGKFDIGDIVVSLTGINSARNEGDIFKVLDNSSISCLYYRTHIQSARKEDWRLATPNEVMHYKDGIGNIKHINQEPQYEIY